MSLAAAGGVMAMVKERIETREPAISSALVDVIEAGQRVVLDRIDLARLDTLALAMGTLRAALLAAAGGILLCGAWFGLAAVLVMALRSSMPLSTALAVVSAINAVLGSALLLLGSRQAGSKPRAEPDVSARDDQPAGAPR